MKRRDFLKQAATVGLASTLAISSASSQAVTGSARPKNVIFITVDQQCANELGCMGNPRVKTPRLDRMAAEGVLFRQMHCQAITCGPSRVAMVTGRYCHATGMHRNDTILPSHEQTLAEIFRDAGYHCVALGKVENHGVEEGRTDVSEGFLQGFHEYYGLDKGPKGDLTKAFIAGQGPYEGTDRHKYTAVWAGDEEDHFDVRSLRRAQRLLKERREDPKFLWLSFHQPHRPICPPKRFVEPYDPTTIPLPPSASMTLENRPKAIVDYAVSHGTTDITEDEIRTLIARRYAAASFLDDCIGQLRDTIRELEQERDTVLVYISDGGSYAGNYGWYQKMPFMLYDCLTHVPALIWAPGRVAPTQPTDALTEQIDLAPTLLELAGVGCPAPMQGQSLLPLMRGEVAALHDAVFAETGFDLRCIMVRTREWKFIYHHDCPHELYHLAEDPEEVRNVYGQYPEIETELRDRLIAWRMDTGSPVLRRRKRKPGK